MATKFSLITVTYNSAEALKRFGPEKQADEGLEWIVVDNGSQDDSVEVAAKLGAHVVVLGENVGFGRANNRGLAEAAGRYIGFVNPDLAVQVGDLTAIADHLDRGRPHLVVPQLLEPDGRDQPNGRGIPTLTRKIRNRTNFPSKGYQITVRPGEDRFVAWGMGAAVFAHRATLEAIGAWDERFFVYYEDHDLGLRAWRHGYPVVLHGDVRWVHGWARETTQFRLRPWLLEAHGAWKFFTRYPELLLNHKMYLRGSGELRHVLGQQTAEFSAAAELDPPSSAMG